MAKLLVFILLLVSYSLSAQLLPVDNVSGKIHFAEEVLVKDAPHTDLYHRANEWLKRTENNNAVLVKADPANGLLVANSSFTIKTQLEKTAVSYKIAYTLQIEVADDKYWYNLYHFKGQELPNSIESNAGSLLPENKSLEEILYPENKSASEFTKMLETSVHHEITNLLKSLKASML